MSWDQKFINANNCIVNEPNILFNEFLNASPELTPNQVESIIVSCLKVSQIKNSSGYSSFSQSFTTKYSVKIKLIHMDKQNQCEEELLEYNEREYIQKLVYKGETLNKNVLPNSRLLKEIRISNNIVGDVIPDCVETVGYGFTGYKQTNINSLPITIHTIKGVIIKTYDQSDIKQIISPNITSISFDTCPNIPISIKIPNTIRSLEFTNEICRGEKKLRKGDIPEGITSLSMIGYSFTDFKGILPNSISILKIGNKNFRESFNFDFLPSNIESLYIKYGHCITRNHKLYSHHSIKQLAINCNGFDSDFEPYSFPQSLTKLSINFGTLLKIDVNIIPITVRKLKITFDQFNEKAISKDAIPNSVVSLTLDRTVYIENSFPPLLKKLKYQSSTCSPNIEYILSKIPQSLTSITLPISLKSKKLSIPQRINNVYYK